MRQRKIKRNYNQGQNNQDLGMKMCQLADGRVIAYDDYIKELKKRRQK